MPKAPSQAGAVYVFSFTLPHSDTVTWQVIKQWMKDLNTKKHVYQQEQGKTKEDGTPGYLHWQGMFSLETRTRLSTLLSRLKDGNILPKAHLSVQSLAGKDQWSYASKAETRIAGPWSSTDQMAYIPRQVRGVTLRKWQQTICDDAPVWTPRIINVVINTTGNIGKSILVSYMRAHKIAQALPLVRNYKDLMRIVYCLPTATMYLIDMPRAIKQENMGEFWAGVESIKDGYVYDDRYTFKEKHFDTPNVWVFTNTAPDPAMLSTDRWLLWEVVGEDLIAYQTPITADAAVGLGQAVSAMGQPHAAQNFAA